MKIIAIVLTFNRLDLLKKNINSIINQTKKPDAVLIIINGSNDETLNFFLKNNQCKKYKYNIILIKNYKNSKIDFYIKSLKYNQGSAGGFNVGLSIACKLNFDWFWIMDDDIEPIKIALQTILRYRNNLVQCIQAKRKFASGEEVPMGIELCEKTGEIINKDIFKNLSRDYAEIKAGCWEGMFISKKLVKEIGFPEKNFYFYNDDAYYGYLASRKALVILINKYLYKKNVKVYFKNFLFLKKIFRPKNDIIYYYWIRNKFLIFNLFKEMNTFSKLGYLIFLRDFLITIFALILIDKSFKRVFYCFRGLFDGLLGNFGKGFYKW